ncbi:tetratricopeptide repeat protein [Pelagicoccus mobilis]|uniref:Tetratricopeptide repeat protein n=1 Tax=Pelagicoccus mobilis TaxID=415221 RepID=A0A934RQY6_9BACT|nr:tetratricopeptide repeat protein [Pelagicoccus mobilis]MBK1875282.1 tetratricopeptide repeat protein [Pelagicoccus mobilis]
MKQIFALLAVSLPALPALASDLEPTFAKDIAPIIYENCVDCHNPNGVGPFSFTSYEQVRRRSQQILDVLEDGFMPPWMPAHGYGPKLKDTRSISDEEIALLRHWHGAGRPAGNLAEAPAVPIQKDGWTYGEPDLVIEMQEAYTLSAEGMDQFRNFVMPIPIGEKRYLKALEFLPESRLAVHHAVIAFDPTPASRMQDAADPLPGYESMDLGGALRPFGHLIGWTPGQVPYETYPGTSFPLTPGVDLVVQLHMLPSGKEEQIAPRIGLYFTDEPPTEMSMVIQLRANAIDIPPGEKNYEIEERFTLPITTHALGIFPHAHFLGKDMRIWIESPEGEKDWLLRIPDWDFNWQSDYRYQEPVTLPQGSEIVMRYSYDNSADNIRNPSSPPVRVTNGFNSYDEMGEVAIQVLLEKRSDWAILQESQARYDLVSTKNNPIFKYNLAQALNAQKRTEEAIEIYEDLIEETPNSVQSMLDLSQIYQQQGRANEAVELLIQASAIAPNFLEPHQRLAQHYRSANQFQQAAAALEHCLSLDPKQQSLRLQLANIYSKQEENPAKAIQVLLAGLSYHRDSASYQYRIAKEYQKFGDNSTALTYFKKAANLWKNQKSPQAADAYYNLAVSGLGRHPLPTIITFLDQAIAADPKHGFSHLMAASMKFKTGDKAAANKHINTLARLSGETVPPVLRSAEMLPFPAGTLAFAQALANANKNSDALNVISWAKQTALSRQQRELAERLSQIETAFSQSN